MLLPKLGSAEVNAAMMMCVPGVENEALQPGTMAPAEMGFVQSVVVIPASVSETVTVPAVGRADPLGVMEIVELNTTTSLTSAVGDDEETLI